MGARAWIEVAGRGWGSASSSPSKPLAPPPVGYLSWASALDRLVDTVGIRRGVGPGTGWELPLDGGDQFVAGPPALRGDLEVPRR